MTDFVIPDEAVEAAAAVLVSHPLDLPQTGPRAENFRLSETARQRSQDIARDALEAALPHLRAHQARPVVDREALERLAAKWEEMDTPGLSSPENQQWAQGVDSGYSAAAWELRGLLADADVIPALLPTEAETKALAETATEVGRRLGRKEAAEAIANKLDGFAADPHGTNGEPASWAFSMAAGIARDITKGTA